MTNLSEDGPAAADEPLAAFLARTVTVLHWTEGNMHGWASVPRTGGERRAEVLTLVAARDGWVPTAGATERLYAPCETPSPEELSPGWLSESDNSFDMALCCAMSWTTIDLAVRFLGIEPPEAHRPTPALAGALRRTCLSIADTLFPRDVALLAWLGREAAAMTRSGALGLRGALFYAGAGQVATRRRQAALRAPWMARALPRMADVVRLVDAGLPHERALAGAARFGASHEASATVPVPPAALRRMRTLDVFTPEAAALARTVAGVPPEWLPRTPEAWDAMSFAAFPADLLSRQLGMDAGRLLSGTRGDWEGAAATLSRRHGLDTEPDLSAEWQVAHVRDTAAHLAGTLVDPLLHACGAARGGVRPHRLAAELLFRGLGLNAVLARTARHHARVVALERALPREGGAAAWATLFPPVATSNGLEVACLATAAELVAEGTRGACPDGGEGMDHCVVVHATACLQGATHIASVRRHGRDGFERVATARIEVEGGAAVLRELRGRGNAAAHPAALEAVGEALSLLAAGKVPMDPGAAARADAAWGHGGDAVLWDRYHPSRTNLEAALAAWRPLLAMPYAGMDLDGIASALGLGTVAH